MLIISWLKRNRSCYGQWLIARNVLTVFGINQEVVFRKGEIDFRQSLVVACQPLNSNIPPFIEQRD